MFRKVIHLLVLLLQSLRGESETNPLPCYQRLEFDQYILINKEGI